MRCQCPECPECKRRGEVRTFFAVGGRKQLCWWCWSDWLRKVRTVPNEEIPMKPLKPWYKDVYNLLVLAGVLVFIFALLPSSCQLQIHITQKPSGEQKP